MRSVWRRFDALGGDTNSAFTVAHASFNLFISTLKLLVSPRPTQPGVSA